jgi:hypothetical protein
VGAWAWGYVEGEGVYLGKHIGFDGPGGYRVGVVEGGRGIQACDARRGRRDGAFRR